MKIILSRKGFDSKYGGVPSPIMPDGTLLSLPIPDSNKTIPYSQLHYNNEKTYADIIGELTNKKFQECHLDPDIRKDILLSRPDGWKGAFGQSGSARNHLDNQKVEVGDLFLFFGWFRKVEKVNDKYQYIKGTDKHIIWGYLQIGEIISNPTKENCPSYLTEHPHFERPKAKPNNTMFIARDNLSWDENKPGAGVLKYKPELVLTKEGMTRSCWKLDDFMNNEDIKISYHNENSWRKDEKGKVDYFKSAEIGQEFVISSEKEDLMLELQNWASNLIGADSSKL